MKIINLLDTMKYELLDRIVKMFNDNLYKAGEYSGHF